jgi:superfamily II DNA or RNA helicase
VTVARLALSEHEAAVLDVFGTRLFRQAKAHLDAGDVVDLRWERQTGQLHGTVRDGGSARATVTAVLDADGAPGPGTCGCQLHPECAHPAALVLAAVAVAGTVPGLFAPAARSRKRAQPAEVSPAWEAALSTLVGAVAPAAPATPPPAGIGLQFELIETASGTPHAGRAAATRHTVTPTRRIALRPVVPGRTGWVRGGISWANVSYAGYGGSVDDRHRRLLQEILVLATAANGQHYYGSYQQTVFLDSFGSRRIWDLLAEAQEIGLPLVQAGKWAAPVVVASSPARVCVRAGRDGADLLLAPALEVDGAPILADSALLVGRPAHGVAWWTPAGPGTASGSPRVLRLATLARPLDRDLGNLLANEEIRIPAADEARFFQQFYPDLRRRVEVTPVDGSVRLPDLGPPTLTLTGEHQDGHRLSLAWEWAVPLGDSELREPLWEPDSSGPRSERDRVVRRVSELVADPELGLLEQTSTGPRLAASAMLAGDSMIRFLTEVAPRLAELDSVAVDLNDSHETYREAHDGPVISFTDTGTVPDGQTDWFDLAVQVTVGGEDVAFNELFTALAQDHRYLILPGGTYFSLDRHEFRQLRELIAEARALQDAPPGTLRVGRFQAGLWRELAELGEVTGQAAAWQAKVRALTDATATMAPRPPKGLRATLRAYQRDGFQWLVTLYDHGLGGVLADDMGLGKTLQALALICHARANVGSPAPFLVVAPASVVYNWASEAQRFTPGLAVRTITQTRARRGVDLAEAVAGAELVVTSYTLFRLEYDEYAQLEWSGLVLDEAQFVKNPAGQGHRCAKQLPASFKLAITGTPLENNLAELWALLSITAPGLLPRLDRFTDYYRNPIEKGKDADRLAQLRRRIRPLMLRRRKVDVVSDLPDKQEQVIELDLNPKHRKAYQTYLQRERQKVLGLLGDLQKNRFEIFRSLTLLRQASLDIALVDAKQRNISSTKLDALTEQVTNLVAEGHRTLVFSQFTRFLQAARQRLEAAGIPCRYLDGSTRDRSSVIASFKDGTAPVFLISLKAGGFGLNLTEADYCILLDPWWNPATEAQAVDRVHRIGQTRPVMVYRLVAKDTIEEKVMALKARKAELFSSVLDGGDFASTALTAADIRGLLD